MSQIDAKDMRRCCDCGEYKPLNEFSDNKSHKQNRCKECYRSHRRKWEQTYRKKATQLGMPPMPEILKPEYWVFTGGVIKWI